MLVRCCVCRRILMKFGLGVGDPETLGVWHEPVDKDPSQPDEISDTYCPRCEKEFELRTAANLKEGSQDGEDENGA